MRLLVIFAILCVWALSSCDSSVDYSQSIVFPDKNVSYTKQVEPFLKVNCAMAGCHATGYATPYLDNYSSMISFTGLIVPGNPSSSVLIQIITDSLPHTAVYFSRAGINENHKKGMAQWVKEGAIMN